MKYILMFLFLCSTCFAQDLTSATLNAVADEGGSIRYVGLVGAVPQTHRFIVNKTVTVAFAQGRSMQNMVQVICNTYSMTYGKETDLFYGLTQEQRIAKKINLRMKAAGYTEEQQKYLMIDKNKKNPKKDSAYTEMETQHDTIEAAVNTEEGL